MNLVEAVIAHAEENYDQGWSLVVECYEKEDVAEIIGDAQTISGAIGAFEDIIDFYRERVTAAAIAAGQPSPWG